MKSNRMNIDKIIFLKEELERELSGVLKKEQEREKRQVPSMHFYITAPKDAVGIYKSLVLLSRKNGGELFKEAMCLLKNEYELKHNINVEQVDPFTKLPRRIEHSRRKNRPSTKYKKLLKDIDELLDAQREQNAAKFDIT